MQPTPSVDLFARLLTLLLIIIPYLFRITRYHHQEALRILLRPDFPWLLHCSGLALVSWEWSLSRREGSGQVWVKRISKKNFSRIEMISGSIKVSSLYEYFIREWDHLWPLMRCHDRRDRDCRHDWQV